MIKYSNQEITITGWYKYAGHVNEGNFDCFIPMQSSRMLFKRGEKTPMLGSCNHLVKWEFIEVFNK